jgi:hypothetical protein
VRRLIWESRIYARLAATPDAATPLQRTQLLEALAVGSEIIQLRHGAHRVGLGADLAPALAAFAQSNCGSTVTHPARLDAALAARGDAGRLAQTLLRARGNILGLPEALTSTPLLQRQSTR